MPGRGLYLVGKDQAFPGIQDAIRQLEADQGSSTFTFPQEIRIVQAGVYPGFLVPATLKPGSYGLTIGADPDVSVAIDSKLNPNLATGALVESGTLNVKLHRLIFNNFRFGVAFGTNADDGTVSACRFIGCREAIYTWNCSRMVVANNAIAYGRRGIVMHSVHGAFIAHNSIYLPQDASNSALEMAGLVVSQKGTQDEDFSVFNNSILAEGGSCILLTEETLDDIISDYNNLYAPGGSAVSVTYKAITTATRFQPARTEGLSLGSWRLLANQDKNSVSLPPEHVSLAVPVDLALKATSALAGRGADITTLVVERTRSSSGTFIKESSNAIPGWAEDVTADIAGAPRGNPPTIGAYELTRVETEENNDPVTQPTPLPALETTGEDLPCGTRASVIDLAALRASKHAPCWLPKVHRGYFYARDIPYYLYAEKMGVTLDDITFSEWDLDVDPFTGVNVMIGGEEVDSGQWALAGSKLLLHHKGLDLDYRGQEVVVEADYLFWDTGDTGFDSKLVRYELHTSRAKRRYILPVQAVDAGPIVVTDNNLHPMNDRSHLPGQFRTAEVVEPWGQEIEFGVDNLLRNPDFSYSTNSLPDDWDTTGTLSLIDQTGELFPYHGQQMLSFGASTGEIMQTVPIDPSLPYAVSFMAAADDTGHYVLTVTQYDSLRRLLGTVSTDTGTVTSTTWSQVEYGLSTGDFDPLAAWLEIRLACWNKIRVDAVQFEQAETATNFACLPRGHDLTIEFETSEGLLHTPKMDISPFRNRVPNGFLRIGNVPAHQFDTGAPTDATTLTESDWTYGRTDVLPWARINGIGKWQRVRNWDLENLLVPIEDAVHGIDMPQPAGISIDPSVPVIRQSSRGDDMSAEVVDTFGNPYAFEEIKLLVSESRGAFPGYLGRREYGYYTHLGPTINPESDNRGQIVGRYIPPLVQQIEYRGPVPPVMSGVAYIETPYEVSRENNANATLHDRFGKLLDLTGIDLTGVIHARPDNGYSIFDLEDSRPVFGTIQVREQDDTGWGYPLEETRNPLMDDTQFYVDYDANRIVLSGTRDPIQVTYQKKLLWTEQTHTHRIYIDEAALTGLTGEVVVRYDAKLSVSVVADKPAGISTGVSTHKTTALILQNPHRGEIR